MSTRIEPSTGRVVLYWLGNEPDEKPMAALVANVHNSKAIAVAYFDHAGHAHNDYVVPLIQEGEERPDSPHCTWMPFQVGQARRYNLEAAEPKPNPHEDIYAYLAWLERRIGV